jgi:YD repeat-containing protein
MTFLVPLALGTQYKYDNLHRLTRVIYNNGMQITYTYDEVGNRTQRVSTLMADTSVDGTVNFKDFAILASRWLEEDCGYMNEWCAGADINRSITVDTQDLTILSDQWLEGISP